MSVKVISYPRYDVTTVTPEDTSKAALIPDPSTALPKYAKISSKVNLEVLGSIFENDRRVHRYSAGSDDEGSGYVTKEAFEEYVANASASAWKMEVVSALPSTPESNTFYLVKQVDGTYEEYVFTGNDWDVIGDTSVIPEWNPIS